MPWTAHNRSLNFGARVISGRAGAAGQSTTTATGRRHAPRDSVPNPGSAFCKTSGKFYDFEVKRPEGESATITVTRFWPDPRSWQKEIRRLSSGDIETRGWKGRGRYGSLAAELIPGPQTEPEAARLRARRSWNRAWALARVPASVLAAVRSFPPGHQWAVLNLLARAPEFLNRVSSDPLIVLIVAHSNSFRTKRLGKPYRAARGLSKRSNRDILKRLGWSGARSTVRLLRKVDLFSATVRTLVELRNFLHRHPSNKTIKHLPRITPWVVNLLEQPYHRVSFNFLCELCELGPTAARPNEMAAGRASRLPQAIQSAWTRLERPGRPGSLASLRHGKRELKLLNVALLALDQPVGDGGRWRGRKIPAAPLPVVPSGPDPRLEIRPLDSPSAIRRHALTMRNCLASSPAHLDPISAGCAAAYEFQWTEPSLRRPLRGTAFLKLDRCAVWALADIKLSTNRTTPDWLVVKICGWLFRSSSTLAPATDLLHKNPAARRYLLHHSGASRFPASPCPGQLDFAYVEAPQALSIVSADRRIDEILAGVDGARYDRHADAPPIDMGPPGATLIDGLDRAFAALGVLSSQQTERDNRTGELF